MSSPEALSAAVRSGVRGSFAAHSMLATLSASIVVTGGEVHAFAGAAEPRLVAAMQATMMAVAPSPAGPDVPAT